MRYAIVMNGVVSNIIMGLPSGVPGVLLDDRPVFIGDTYSNGKFYREGVEVLTAAEYAVQLEAAIDEIEGELNA